MKLYVIFGYECDEFDDTVEGAKLALRRIKEIQVETGYGPNEIKIIRGEDVNYLPPSSDANLSVNGRKYL